MGCFCLPKRDIGTKICYHIIMNPDLPIYGSEFQDEIAKSENIESREGIPMRINDLRNPSALSFDLDKFINTIARLKSEGLYKLSKEFRDSDYGKYMSVFASAESDNWDEAIQNAKAMEITLTTPPDHAMEFLKDRTAVEVKVLMDGKEGKIFRFTFNKEGKYHQGGWDDVYLQKRLVGENENSEFSLTINEQPEAKKLGE